MSLKDKIKTLWNFNQFIKYLYNSLGNSHCFKLFSNKNIEMLHFEYIT